MLSRVDPGLRAPQALCMCPTRELVIQNRDVATKMAKFAGISIATTADDEAYASKEPVRSQLVIGTPGRVKNWVTKRFLALDRLQVLV